ncbi:MAG: copper ion binding protein [Thermodesulfovibrionales bacterium]
MTRTTIEIDGMSCMHCAQRVKKAIEALAGITELNVEVGKASVGFDETRTSQQEIEAAIAKAGYTVRR